MLIGLCGKKQAGKSTITDYLVSKGWVEISFAYPLKEIIGRELFGFNDEQLYGPEEVKEAVVPEWNMSPRKVLQIVGTDMFRKYIREDFWVYLAKKRVIELQMKNPNINIVISDCRFPNELDMIKDLDGTVIRVIRPDKEHVDSHESENALNDYIVDFEIEAKSGDIKGLKFAIDEYIEELRKIHYAI